MEGRQPPLRPRRRRFRRRVTTLPSPGTCRRTAAATTSAGDDFSESYDGCACEPGACLSQHGKPCGCIKPLPAMRGKVRMVPDPQNDGRWRWVEAMRDRHEQPSTRATKCMMSIT